MWHWRDDDFTTLRNVAAEAAHEPEWSDYSKFCFDYERGLRPQAFATLERFIHFFERKPFAERRRFVSWLMTLLYVRHRTDGLRGQHKAVPHPLRLRIIEPTLLEWTAVEPHCAEPHRWLGGYEHLKSAVDVDSTDVIARRKLITLILSNVGYSTHELPEGYIGEPHQDLALLHEAAELLDGIPNGDERRQLEDEIAEERSLIQEYLRGKS
jgi:hypothetical protein